MADIMFFSAHPDDAEFGAGGTMLKLAKKQSVINIILTRGEAGTYGTPEIREQEALNAAKTGNYEAEFLNFKDNHIEDNAENAKILASIIRKHKPKVIIAPFHTNNFSHKDGAAHPDHTATGRLARKAARFAKFKNADIEGEAHAADKIIYYMLPKFTKPSFVIDISDVIEELKQLWNCHKSQMEIKGGKLAEFLMMYRKTNGLLAGKQYAEHFVMEEPITLSEDDFLSI